jgi:hypothetical protein
LLLYQICKWAHRRIQKDGSCPGAMDLRERGRAGTQGRREPSWEKTARRKPLLVVPIEGGVGDTERRGHNQDD